MGTYEIESAQGSEDPGGSRMVQRPDIQTQRDRLETFDLAVAHQPLAFERADLFRWFHEHASWVEDVWIEGRIAADTVNDPRRQHVPAPRDLLFATPGGRYERYDPAMHGWWSKAGRPVSMETRPSGVTSMVRAVRPGGAEDRPGWRRRKAG
jgi:hypothetical protein